MTRDGKSRIAILAGLGIVVVLLVWAFIASLPASGSKEPETGEVILRTRIKDSFTLDDMLQKVGKENTSKSASLSGFDPVTEEPADTAGNEREIRRIQELIRDNERKLGAGITVPVQQPVASRGKEKPALQEKKEEEVRPGSAKPWIVCPGHRPAGDSTRSGSSGRKRGMSSRHSCTPHRPLWSVPPSRCSWPRIA